MPSNSVTLHAPVSYKLKGEKETSKGLGWMGWNQKGACRAKSNCTRLGQELRTVTREEVVTFYGQSIARAMAEQIATCNIKLPQIEIEREDKDR